MAGQVALAFGHKAPPLVWQRRADLEADLVLIPHPSGINRWYNVPENRELARAVLSEMLRAEAGVT